MWVALRNLGDAPEMISPTDLRLAGPSGLQLRPVDTVAVVAASGSSVVHLRTVAMRPAEWLGDRCKVTDARRRLTDAHP